MERWRVGGGLEGTWRLGRLEGWRAGEAGQNWVGGLRVGGRGLGLEGWTWGAGGLEGWRAGRLRLEGRRAGGAEGWKVDYSWPKTFKHLDLNRSFILPL